MFYIFVLLCNSRIVSIKIPKSFKNYLDRKPKLWYFYYVNRIFPATDGISGAPHRNREYEGESTVRMIELGINSFLADRLGTRFQRGKCVLL